MDNNACHQSSVSGARTYLKCRDEPLIAQVAFMIGGGIQVVEGFYSPEGKIDMADLILFDFVCENILHIIFALHLDAFNKNQFSFEALLPHN